jgi:hypothetical protein
MPHPYVANYCEENVWHLAAADDLEPGIRRVVMVASLGDAVPLWCQRAAPAPGEVVLWDYHVFLAVSGASPLIYDLDTTLPFPCPLEVYVAQTFGPGRDAPTEFQPRFRVIEAGEYRRSLGSDRSHMRRDDGSWTSPPPSWAAPQGEALPLLAAIDMEDRSLPGQVYDLVGLMRALRQ